MTFLGNEKQRELEELIILDSESFEAVMQAMKLTKSTPEEVAKREKSLEDAYRKATSVPLQVMEKSLQALELARITAEKGNLNSVSDAGVAALLGQAAVQGAYLNVMINLPSLEDHDFKSQVQTQAEQLRTKAAQLAQSILNSVSEKLGCPKDT